jgi:hypothetical protein
MSVQPPSDRQAPQDVIVPYGPIAKILKVPVFRLALGNDPFSQLLISVYNFFSRLWPGQSRSFRSFDPAIAERSVDRFVALGAQTQFVVPRDGRGEIQMMTFKAQDLEKRIVAAGGSWERRVIEQREVFAIVPPEKEGADWFNLKEKLSHFGWREEQGMLITCDCADAIPDDAPTQCFLYTHSTSGSFASDWKRAGFYIGAKQDFCFFDNGNTWKNNGRPPSEESFYLEIDAVFDEIANRYPMDQLWVGGSCGGAPVAAYLKRRFHDQGINFFSEQSFADLNDFVEPISPFFAPRVKGCLNDQPLPEDMEHRPPACQFGVAKLWENLPRYEAPGKGKFILVQVRDDEHIKPEAYQRYLHLAHKINADVKHLLYSSTSNWHHSDDFFRYETPRRQFVQAVFGHQDE